MVMINFYQKSIQGVMIAGGIIASTPPRSFGVNMITSPAGRVLICPSVPEVRTRDNHGSQEPKFDKDTIDNGEMIIEKTINNISFQLKNDFGNTLFTLQYNIKLK